MTTLEESAPNAGSEAVAREQTLSEMLQATASSFAAARAVLENAAQTAFAFFSDAGDADRALLMRELAETTLVHDAMLAGYAKALDSGAEGGNALAKRHGYRNVAELLQHELGRRAFDTQMMIRLGEVLRDGTYPTLAVALEDGRVSLQQAHVIVDVLDDEIRRFDPDTIEYVEAAATEFAIGAETALPMKPEQLRKLIRAWFKKLQPEKTELEAAEQYELREASYGTTKTGMVRVRALLPAAEGAAVLQFLDANAAPKVRFIDPELRETSCCCTEPDNRCEAKHGTTPDDGEPLLKAHCSSCVPNDARTRKQKMADAFARAFTVAAKTNDTSRQGGACPTLVVTMPLAALDQHAAGIPAVAALGRTEEVVPAHVAARMLCDGAVRAAVTGDDGEVLYLGRSQRCFTPAQRTALAVTYPTCAVPDCDIPAVWCEAHHVRWWSRSGATDIDNGVLLCNFHHHRVHAGTLDIVPGRTRVGRYWTVTRTTRVRTGASGLRDPSGSQAREVDRSNPPPMRRAAEPPPSGGEPRHSAQRDPNDQRDSNSTRDSKSSNVRPNRSGVRGDRSSRKSSGGSDDEPE